MLNTDLHNPAIKEERRMTRDGFIRNTPGFLVGISSIFWRESWKYGERAFRYCNHRSRARLDKGRLNKAFGSQSGDRRGGSHPALESYRCGLERDGLPRHAPGHGPPRSPVRDPSCGG